MNYLMVLLWKEQRALVPVIPIIKLVRRTCGISPNTKTVVSIVMVQVELAADPYNLRLMLGWENSLPPAQQIKDY
jgi:hypothetical protein